MLPAVEGGDPDVKGRAEFREPTDSRSLLICRDECALESPRDALLRRLLFLESLPLLDSRIAPRERVAIAFPALEVPRSVEERDEGSITTLLDERTTASWF